MTPRAVVFDLDGTLADTLRTITRALNAGLTQFGLAERRLSEVAAMVGEGIGVLCERALPPERRGEKDAVVRAVRAAYAAEPLFEARLFDGMAETLRGLIERGARLAILSNKPDALTCATITGLGLDDSFAVVLGHKEEFPRKPDPTSLRFVLDRLGVAPADTLFVGDTSIDMETARAAGATAIAVSWGFRGIEELMPHRPDHVVHFPARILEVFDERFGGGDGAARSTLAAAAPIAGDAMIALPNAHGFLEAMVEHDDVFDVHGWMLDVDGPFETVALEGIGDARVVAGRVVREDVVAAVAAVQSIPHAAYAGFHVRMPRARLPAATHAQEIPFRLVGERGGRRVAVMRAAFFRSPRAVALPPAPLMRRVAHTDLDYIFTAGGMKACSDLAGALRRHLPASKIHRVLDWGSGCARVTRYLPIALPGADVDGADIDAEAVRWSAEHFPEACFHVCGVDPPLPFPAGSFDAVLGGSVFTHLPRGHQATWLAELHRVLAPGGVAVVTTLGDFAVRHRMQHAPPGLAREGIDDSEQDPTLAGVAPAGFYRATYQTRAWTEREWSRTFNVLEFEAGGYSCIQDVWVLRRR